MLALENDGLITEAKDGESVGRFLGKNDLLL